MNNESIYASIAVAVFVYTVYNVYYRVVKTTDKHDSQLMEAFVTAKRKGLIK